MIPFWCAPLFVLVHPEALFADRDEGTCRDNKDEFGFALVGHDYSTIRADNFGHCFLECSSGEKCQSVTFLWNTKECKLNNETKKSRPEAFQKHPAATYMENQFRAKKGSKALVPGSSCKDILISGDSHGDGEYWIEPTASGDPYTVFCNMATECQHYQSINTVTYGCDNRLGPGWFRFEGAAGTRMANSCQSRFKCSTAAEGWIDGLDPSVADGHVTRKVCFRHYANCCKRSTYIKAKNCSSYFVYYLRGTPGCDLRYCGIE